MLQDFRVMIMPCYSCIRESEKIAIDESLLRGKMRMNDDMIFILNFVLSPKIDFFGVDCGLLHI
jgi:hypothetical protein